MLANENVAAAAHEIESVAPSRQPPLQINRQPIIYSSAELLKGRREVWIEHGDQMYRLRLTSGGKLYVTK
ncbi:MAG TPA: hemin uptake protein HemP [Pirellulales bacterium]